MTQAAAPGFVSFVGSGPGDPDLLTLKAVACLQPVSYTHLTLPTIYSV